LSLEDELVQGVAGENVEAVEGFWLKRPWLFDAACPIGPVAPTPTPTAGPQDADADREPSGDEGDQAIEPGPAIQRIGIAQFFTPQDSRAGRRINRPFEAVRQLKAGESAGQQGFNMILSGRLRAHGDGRVILCAGEGRDRPPDCIISADVDRVLIERPDDQEILAEWTV
jgi:hypothetical protein